MLDIDWYCDVTQGYRHFYFHWVKYRVLFNLEISTFHGHLCNIFLLLEFNVFNFVYFKDCQWNGNRNKNTSRNKNSWTTGKILIFLIFCWNNEFHKSYKIVMVYCESTVFREHQFSWLVKNYKFVDSLILGFCVCT